MARSSSARACLSWPSRIRARPSTASAAARAAVHGSRSPAVLPRPRPGLPQHPHLTIPPHQRGPARLGCARLGCARLGYARRRPAVSVARGRTAVLLAQNRQVQLPCLRRRVGTEVAAEPLPERLVNREGLRWLACRGRGRHVPPVRRLVERIGGHGRFRIACRQPRVPGRQRRLGRGQPHPAQQPAYLLAGRIGPVRVRLVADRGARGQQLMRSLGRGQRHRDRGDQLSFGLVAKAGRRVQVHDDARGGGQSVPRPATLDELGAQHRAEPADQGRDVLLGRSRPLVRP